MQIEPVEDEVPQPAVPGRLARIRAVQERLASMLGVDPSVVAEASQHAEDLAVEMRRILLILAVAENQRELNRLHGEQAELHARALEMGLRADELAGTSSPATEVRSLAAEVGAVSGRSQRSVQIEFGRADAIANDFEDVQVAMKAGSISRTHALVMVESGLRIVHPDAEELARRRAEFARVVLPLAATTTPGRLKSFANRVAEELTEESLDERFARARRTRRVTLRELEDGLGELCVIDSHTKLVAVYDRTTRQARVISDAERRAAREHASRDQEATGEQRTSGEQSGEQRGERNGDGALATSAGAHAMEGELPEPRTLDEVRADVLTESFLKATPEELKGRAPIQAKVSFVIPTETMLAPGHGASSDSGSSSSSSPGSSSGSAGGSSSSAGGGSGSAAGSAGGGSGSAAGSAGGSAIEGAGATGADASGAAGVFDPVAQPQETADGHPRVSPAPALLNGYTPVPTAEVRQLIDLAPELGRIFTDPVKGTLVEVDSYRPTSAMRRRLAARDGRCRFVGCMMPANRCEIDHTRAWEDGGPTSLPNLGHLCLGHHIGKHHGDWEVEQLPDGNYEWRSPAGMVFVDEPVRFGRLTSPEPRPTPAATTRPAPSARPPHKTSSPDAPKPADQPAPADCTTPAGRTSPPYKSSPPGRTPPPDKTPSPGQQTRPRKTPPPDPHGSPADGIPAPSRGVRDDGMSSKNNNDDRRARFAEIGFLEEFKRERAAKKRAIEAESGARTQPQFRPSGQRGDTDQNPPSRTTRTGTSDDDPPF